MSKYCILNETEIKKNNNYNIGKISPFDAGIPLVDISDKTIEEIYYFRWHTFCKHIKNTPDGFVITEFFPDVPWAGKHNAICCPASHQFYEGRWLHNTKYLDSYSRFWFLPDVNPRSYSGWMADGIYAIAKVWGDYKTVELLYEKLKENFFAWEREKGSKHGLFYQIDDRDGMEFSAGGSGIRPTLSCYMYGDALAISKIAKRLKKYDEEELFSEKAKYIKEKINEVLWDENSAFYKTLNVDTDSLVSVRELVGYIPWYFNIPKEKMNNAWEFINDKNHFYAPFGPTTTEQCCPDFMKEYDHECLWNGPSWPFATSQTLTAMNNFINNYNQSVVEKTDYYNLLHLFANSHYLTENGSKVPFIDENLDPFTGEWLARKILLNNPPPDQPKERGKDYNHSTFCDLVISGLAGIVPNDNDTIIINPMFTQKDLDYLCVDGIKYHNHFVTVLWDKSGKRYGFGKGFFVFVDGKQVGRNDMPDRFSFNIKD